MANLIIKGARENNLKSIDIEIEDKKITGIVGPSGSGKSSLAFNTIHMEGQRRYIESLSSYARQFLEKIDKPDYDLIENISPSIAIEQKNKIKNSRASVGYLTEIDDYLRALYSYIGNITCTRCATLINKYDSESIIDDIFLNYRDKKSYLLFYTNLSLAELKSLGFSKLFIGSKAYEIDSVNITEESYFVIFDRFSIENLEKQRIKTSLDAVKIYSANVVYFYILEDDNLLKYNYYNICSNCNYEFPEVNQNLFSYDSPHGACSECKGFGNILKWDIDKLVPDKNKSLFAGAIDLLNKPSMRSIYYAMIEFLREKKIDINKPFKELTKKEIEIIYKGGSLNNKKFYGLNKIFKEFESKQYKLYIKVILSKYRTAFLCSSCNGARLNKDALNVKIKGKNIFELQSISIVNLASFINSLELNDEEKKLCREILKQLYQRTSFLIDLGLTYLTLSRRARTLSNGEAQRINIANQLSSTLEDIIYVLDEPSIGLHSKDTEKLIKIIHKIRDNNNKVIIVEHDKKFIKNFDNIIELGPKSGAMGGEVVFSGNIDSFMNANTYTSNDFNKNKFTRSFSLKPIGEITKFLELKNVTENNLKNIDLKIPLERLVCITGVSGSGKSSLISKCLYASLDKHFNQNSLLTANYDSVSGLENIGAYCLIDQKPISKSFKSMPITYLNSFDSIRDVFANTILAKARNYKNSNFSFNTSQGQCPECKGDGFISVDMHFMSDVVYKCEYCNGTRYKPEVLDITYKGLNISQVLNLTVVEAYDFFINIPSLRSTLKLLIDMGLEYICLGQSADTLSGGEAQRLKILKYLLKSASSKKRLHTLFIMDEPTTGLHTKEVYKLIEIINRLIDEGSSVIVIEHNLDFIANSDYIIDLGPEAGANGGNIVAEGSPNAIINFNSHTARFLKEFINSH